MHEAVILGRSTLVGPRIPRVFAVACVQRAVCLVKVGSGQNQKGPYKRSVRRLFGFENREVHISKSYRSVVDGVVL